MLVSSKMPVIGGYEMRKVGQSIGLTVSQETEISAKTKYLLVAKPAGLIKYQPIENNPWLNGEFDKIDFDAEIAKLGTD
ncbi:hypothetical protein [Lactiplantibacillus songbeiensis]|uniref:Uncharacterized protein n=1 Tax=Lactiplantibacillus songbeiensis TaxID=2559920 RepID=A0ABW4BYY6_9LACO|nr:hypothetical protein [Lactiplantibacillus songbeiensis]